MSQGFSLSSSDSAQKQWLLFYSCVCLPHQRKDWNCKKCHFVFQAILWKIVFWILWIFFCSNPCVSSHCFMKCSSRRLGFWMSLQAVLGMANIVLMARLPALFIEEHCDPQSSSLSRNMWRSFCWWHHPAQLRLELVFTLLRNAEQYQVPDNPFCQDTEVLQPSITLYHTLCQRLHQCLFCQ